MHIALIMEIQKHVQLTELEKELISASFRYKKVRRNQILVHPPEIALYEHFIINGILVEYYINGEGNQHSLVFASEGWWMTDMESFFRRKESKYFI